MKPELFSEVSVKSWAMICKITPPPSLTFFYPNIMRKIRTWSTFSILKRKRLVNLASAPDVRSKIVELKKEVKENPQTVMSISV